jgi:enoyl-CoA hydratase
VTVLLKTATLVAELNDHVAEVTLTRPEKLNAFDSELHHDFVDLLGTVGTAGARAVLLSSTGKVFSAGGDFELMRQVHDDPVVRARVLDEGRQLIMRLIDLPVPVVVALHGDAIGLGASVVLGCDAIVAARTARITDPHVPIGLVAGDGGCLMWPQSVGMLRAKRHLLTGDPMPAEDAFAMGLVTDLVDTPDEVLPAARALADRIAALPPLAVQGTKRALNRVLQQRAGEVFDLSVQLEAGTAVSDDLLEAIAAFKERRPGNYQGR